MEPEIVKTKTINMDPVFTRVLTSGALSMLRFFRPSRGPFSTVLTPTFALKDLVVERDHNIEKLLLTLNLEK